MVCSFNGYLMLFLHAYYLMQDQDGYVKADKGSYLQLADKLDSLGFHGSKLSCIRCLVLRSNRQKRFHPGAQKCSAKE